MNESDFVPEEAIDYDEVFRRGGRNRGYEDFALFKCPFCQTVYLLEYEVDTVYLDATDLARRADVFNTSFDCVSCGRTMPNDRPWAGPKMPPEFAVSWRELRHSPWAWCVKNADLRR